MAQIPINGTNVSIEVFQNSLLGSMVMVRAYVGGVLKPGFIQFQENSSGDYDQLKDILTYCGLPAAAPGIWLSQTPKAEARQAVLKWVREKLIPAVCAFINSFISGTQPAPVPGEPYLAPFYLFEDILRNITFTVGPDGKVSGSI